jgi:hypothetical protein
MTEAEWVAGNELDSMVQFLGDRASSRKKLLFSCTCCRLVEHLFQHALHEEGADFCRRIVEVTERYADGEATAEERNSVGEAAGTAEFELTLNLGRNNELEGPSAAVVARRVAVAAAFDEPLSPAWSEAVFALGWARSEALLAPARRSWPGQEEYQRLQQEASRQFEAGVEEARSVVATLLRDVFGNPFVSPPRRVEPARLAWQGGTVAQLAQAAYEERHLSEGTLDPAQLALVADALEDAGCTDADLLGHLRGPGPHVRGCWALDLLRGKS